MKTCSIDIYRYRKIKMLIKYVFLSNRGDYKKVQLEVKKEFGVYPSLFDIVIALGEGVR